MKRPQLISPIDQVDEARTLFEAGADELYGGLLPDAWQQRYGLLASLNQRTFAQAQLKSFDELAEVVATAREYGKPFSLTLNAPFFAEPQYPLIEELVGRAAEIGVSGVILADPGVLGHLHRQFPALEMHLSTLAHAGNQATLRFYQQLGVRRAVVPRHLDTRTLGDLTAALPELKLDAFVLIGKCPNTEGLCTFHHARSDRIWPCEICYDIAPLAGQESERLASARQRQSSWSESDRRHGCGLCALPALCRAGIHGLKLVGRGAPTAMKKANLLLVKGFLEMVHEGMDEQAYRRAARQAHARRFGSPCSANVCYYPEFCQGEEIR